MLRSREASLHAKRRQSNRARPDLERLEPIALMSTFHVNTVDDTPAVSLKTGKDAAGHISLRSALSGRQRFGASRHHHRAGRHIHADNLRPERE